MVHDRYFLSAADLEIFVVKELQGQSRANECRRNIGDSFVKSVFLPLNGRDGDEITEEKCGAGDNKTYANMGSLEPGVWPAGHVNRFDIVNVSRILPYPEKILVNTGNEALVEVITVLSLKANVFSFLYFHHNAVLSDQYQVALRSTIL